MMNGNALGTKRLGSWILAGWTAACHLPVRLGLAAGLALAITASAPAQTSTISGFEIPSWGPAPATLVAAGPGGDVCADGIPITDGTHAFDNTGGTIDDGGAGDSECQPAEGPDVWFNYTATCDGTLVVTRPTNFLVYVYDTFDCPPTVFLGGCTSSTAFEIGPVNAGRELKIRVHGWGEGTGGSFEGPGELTVTCNPDPTGGCCLPDDTCSTLTAFRCGEAGGFYLGDGAGCPASGPCLGACCYFDGSCDEPISVTVCESTGGRFQGVGVTCNDVFCDPFPENDDCGQRLAITDGATAYTNLFGASVDGPPFSCLGGSLQDIWFNYTATCDGVLVVQDSGFNALDLWSGFDDCPPTVPLACDSGTGSIGVPVSSGDQIKIRVGAWNSDAGELTVTCSPPPPNDLCDDRVVITDGTTPYTLIGTSSESQFQCDGFYDDIWFNYTASCDGALTIVDSSSNIIDLWDGFTCPPNSPLGCGTGSVSLNVNDGDEIKIRVGAWNSQNGALTIACDPAPTGGCCLPDDTCSTLTAFRCGEAGGIYLGDDVACPAGPCVGACCFFDGECDDTITVGVCESTGGRFQGLGSTCTPDLCEPFPPNDFCDTRVLITDGTWAFDNTGGTIDGDLLCTPALSPDVWFNYVATADGVLRVHRPTNYIVDVFNTFDCPATDHFFVSCTGAATFDIPVTAAQELKIRIFGWDESTNPPGGPFEGPSELTLECIPSVGGDDCEERDVITDGTVGYSGLFSANSDGPPFDCLPTTSQDLWFNYTATCDGLLTITDSGANLIDLWSGFDCPPTVPLACHFGSGSLSLDVNAGDEIKIRVGGWNTDTGTLTVACDPAPFGACCFAEECINLTEARCANAGGAYQGDDSRCAANPCPDDRGGACCLFGGDCSVEVEFVCLALGGTYQGEGTDCGGVSCSPLPDECDSRIEVFDGTTVWDTTGATLSTPAFPCSSSDAQEDIWFNYEATCTGLLRIDTCGSEPVNDTILAVYDGWSCTLGAVRGCSDDNGEPGCLNSDGNSWLSTVEIPVTAGDQVKIRVASWTGEPQGQGLLNISCRPLQGADECANRTEIFDGTTQYTFSGSTSDGTTFECRDAALDDIWFNYTACDDGVLTVLDSGDNVFELWSGFTCPPEGPLLACDPGTGQPVSIDVAAGDEIKIRMGSWNSLAGTLTLDLAGTTPPEITCPPDVTVECGESTEAGATGPLYGFSELEDSFFRSSTADFLGDFVTVNPAAGYVTSAMDMDPSGTTLYAILHGPPDMVGTIDVATGLATPIATLVGPTATGFSVTGLAVDPTSGLWYLTAFEGGTTNLYVGDVTTGVFTLVGDVGFDIDIDIAIDAFGNAYGHDIVTDTLHSIDLTTGAGTFVGATGFDGNFTQGMDFDYAGGLLYATLFDNGAFVSRFGTFDVTTGAFTELENLGFFNAEMVVASGIATATATATDDCDPNPIVSYEDEVIAGACPQERTILRTWTARDDDGNIASCMQTITVVDTTPPVISCPADVTLECPADTAPAATGFAMAVDNCDGSTSETMVTSSDAITPGSCPQAFTIARTWLATDACGNTTACVQTIIVRDTVAPDISCPGDITVQCTVDTSDPANTGGSAGATDACDDDPNVTFSDSVTAGSCPQEMTITRTWTATDGGCNTSMCVQTITVVDTVGPVALDVPPDRTAPCELVPDAPLTLPGTDNCDPTVTEFTYDGETSTPGDCPQEYTLVRTWSATDACGNPTTVSETIVVVDNTAPVISGVGPDVTLACVISIPTDTVTATDNCAPSGDITLAMNESDNDGSGCLGDPLVITRVWTATDPCGNVATAARTITVEDTEAPTLSGVPASVTVECGPVPPVATVTGSDNCPGVVVAMFEDTTRGDCPQNFTVTRTWVATDACGLSTTAVQVITIQDTTPPTVDAAPSSVTVECDAIPAPAATLGATDDCDGDVSEATLNAPQIKEGPCPNTFVMIRSWTATDACGNATTVSQTIHVQDTTPPVISAPADITVECDAVPDPPKSLDATDNCGEATVTAHDPQIKEGPCPGTFTMIRSWTAVDACGNDATVSQTITVEDTTPPVVVGKAPADTTLECSEGLPVPPKTLDAFDACDDDVAFATLNEPVIIAGACPQEYTMTRSWTATDGCGNSTTVSQTLTVLDTTPPAPLEGAVPPNRVADCQLIPDAPRSIPAADDCDESVTEFTYDGETSEPGPCPQEYTLTRTWSGSDSCGNAATASQTITVVDTTPPSFIGPVGDLTLDCVGDVPPLDAVSVVDNCAAAEDLTLEPSESSNKGAGCPDDPLVITRSYAASDPCANDITLVQTITVVDDEAPVLAGVPKSHDVECGAIPDAADVTASDNCPGVVLAFEETTEPGPCDATVTVTRTWTATDACGNVTEATQVITSVDDTPPTIEGVSGDVTVSCSGDVPRLDEVTATDDCADPDAITIDMSEATNKGAGCPDDPLVLTRSYTATDPCGNVATATQTVTVIDDEAPSLVGVPASTRVSCDAVPTPADVTATDNCPGASVAYSETLTPGVCEDTYTLTRVWIATDACGNETSASQEITVSDLTAPVVTDCDEDLSAHADAGTCEAEVTWSAPDVTDNCDPAPSVTYDIDLDDDGGVDVASHASTTYIFPAGTHRVTAVATDRCGNADDSCTFLVEVSTSNEVLLDIAFAGVMASPITRCITFEFWSCGGETVEVVEQSILFIAGLAEGVSVLVPCGEYDCLTARDTLHTLARTDDDFAAAGSIYVADFADDDQLVGGNANDDETIDILDFGIFVSLFGQPGGGACPTEGPDADFNGDGTVNTPDYTFIANNFFDFADAGCCPGAAGVDAIEPLVAISVADLWKRGLGHLTPADLNADGWLDAQDVTLFGEGVRPNHRVATLKPGIETAWWSDVSTWTLGFIPDETTIVVLERGSVELRESTRVARIEVDAGAWLTVSTGALLAADEVIVHAGAVLELTGRARLSATSIVVKPGGLLLGDEQQIDVGGAVN